MIQIDVMDYCDNCLDFEADVEKPVPLYAGGKEYMTCGNTVIRCENRSRCEKIKKHLKGEK